MFKFGVQKTKYDNIFVKPISILDFEEMNDIEDGKGQSMFVISRSLCDESGNLLFDDVNTMKKNIPIKCLDYLAQLTLEINDLLSPSPPNENDTGDESPKN